MPPKQSAVCFVFLKNQRHKEMLKGLLSLGCSVNSLDYDNVLFIHDNLSSSKSLLSQPLCKILHEMLLFSYLFTYQGYMSNEIYKKLFWEELCFSIFCMKSTSFPACPNKHPLFFICALLFYSTQFCTPTSGSEFHQGTHHCLQKKKILSYLI